MLPRPFQRGLRAPAPRGYWMGLLGPNPWKILWGLPAPKPRGYFALGGKVTKTPPGAPRTPFLPNRLILRLTAGCHRISGCLS